MKTPILGGAYVARSVNAADNRMVNLFPEIIPEGGKEPAFLQRVPGSYLAFYIDTDPIRALYAVNRTLATSSIYVVSYNLVYKIESNAINLIGGPFITGSGMLSMADNGQQIFMSVNDITGAVTDAFVYDMATDTFAQVADPDFPGSGMVTYLDGFFVFNEPGTDKIWVTGLMDGTSIDPLAFASAESCPDGVVGVIANKRELWVFGTSSTEVWTNTGQPNFPFTPISGASTDVGCAAINSIRELDGSVFFLGSDVNGSCVIYRTRGYGVERVSTHAVEWQIQQYIQVNDAEAYCYQQDGHLFYVISFPEGGSTGGHTWAYDVSTGAWHERASVDSGEFVKDRCRIATSFPEGLVSGSVSGKVVIGDAINGTISLLTPDYGYDSVGPIKWLRSWRALATGQNNLKRTAHHSLQIDCETGVGDVITPNPQMSLRFSDDGGHTWSNTRTASMGAANATGTRLIYRRLGMTDKLRDRVYEISSDAPVRTYIMGAELIVSPTDA